MFDEALEGSACLNRRLRRALVRCLAAATVLGIQVIAVCGPVGLVLLRVPQSHPILQCAGAGCLLYLARWQLLRPRGAGPPSASVLCTGEAAAQQFLDPRAWLMSVVIATLLLPPQWEQVLADSYPGMIWIMLLDPLPCATYAFVMSITPGPNNVMLTAAGANFGLRRTVPHILGITCGFGTQVAAVCAGLGILFTRWPQLQLTLKWIGAAYLLYLGWRLLRSHISQSGDAGRPITFRGAALFQFLNPKAWVMSLTAATLFLPPQLGQPLASGYVTSIVTVVNLPCITLWALFGSSLGLVLARPAPRRIFNWLMAVALAATGVMMVA